MVRITGVRINGCWLYDKKIKTWSNTMEIKSIVRHNVKDYHIRTVHCDMAINILYTKISGVAFDRLVRRMWYADIHVTGVLLDMTDWFQSKVTVSGIRRGWINKQNFVFCNVCIIQSIKRGSVATNTKINKNKPKLMLMLNKLNTNSGETVDSVIANH